jgi:hypothetical protein
VQKLCEYVLKILGAACQIDCAVIRGIRVGICAKQGEAAVCRIPVGIFKKLMLEKVRDAKRAPPLGRHIGRAVSHADRGIVGRKILGADRDPQT